MNTNIVFSRHIGEYFTFTPTGVISTSLLNSPTLVHSENPEWILDQETFIERLRGNPFDGQTVRCAPLLRIYLFPFYHCNAWPRIDCMINQPLSQVDAILKHAPLAEILHASNGLLVLPKEKIGSDVCYRRVWLARVTDSSQRHVPEKGKDVFSIQARHNYFHFFLVFFCFFSLRRFSRNYSRGCPTSGLAASAARSLCFHRPRWQRIDALSAISSRRLATGTCSSLAGKKCVW